jgi:aldose 1-epimerase
MMTKMNRPGRRKMMRKDHFGTMPDGKEISLYTLENDRIIMSVSDLGALLVRLYVPDRNGKKDDIVLGYDSGEDYLDNPNCFGATVVPVANRTKNASVVIGGTEYHMTVNEGNNNLHSDKKSFVTMWDVAAQEEEFITFVQERGHLSDGLPGDRRFEVTYKLLPDGVRIDFYVTSTRPTYINPTNHSYFNLAGEASGSILDQTLQMFSSAYTPLGQGQIPTGEIIPVQGTAFDFLTPKAFGPGLESTEPQMVLAGGYDHNFVIDGYTGNGTLNPVACAADPASGRVMNVASTMPGVQLYTANFTDEKNGKAGHYYGKRSGFCLETQFFPDNVHHDNFQDAIFGGGTDLCASTVFSFSVTE